MNRQFGLATRDQAVRAGLSTRQIDYRIRTGAWIREHESVYRHRMSSASWESELLAAVMSSKGIASHRCAAALWGLELYSQPPAEVTVPERGISTASFRLHRSKQWHLRDPVTMNGIPCTGVERTILDCGAVSSARTVERLAEAAIRHRKTSWMKLVDCLSIHSIQGRNGCLNLRRVLQLRLEDRTIPLSDFSRRVAHLLEDGGVPKPVLEYRILDDSQNLIMQADLAWPKRKKAWELDGLQFHFGRTDIERDRRKRNRAKAHGWSIQEILWSMLVQSPDQLAPMAHAFLRS